MRIEDRRVLIDWERGRTDKDFYPKRLGEGIGRGRYNEEENKVIKSIIWSYKDSKKEWKRDVKAE